jgi:hypothetical protein
MSQKTAPMSQKTAPMSQKIYAQYCSWDNLMIAIPANHQ